MDTRVRSDRRWYLWCWHGKRHLRIQKYSNGAAIYCERCFVKKFGWIEED